MRILAEQKKVDAIAAANQNSIADARLTPAPENLDSHVARAALTLNDLTSVLRKLDKARIQYVLRHLPVHQLASALEQVLDPTGDGPLGSDDGEILGDFDGRGAARTETNRAGKIIYNNKTSVSNCIISDYSDTGCQITIETTLGIPDYFTLQVVDGNLKQECEVVWRKHGALGVKYIV